MEGCQGDWEGVRGRREEEVFEGETMAEVFFSRDCGVEVRVAHPFDSGGDECSVR